MVHLSETSKTVGDVLAVVGSLLSWATSILPALASAVTLAWGCIRIYEWYKSKKGKANVHEQLNRLDS